MVRGPTRVGKLGPAIQRPAKMQPLPCTSGFSNGFYALASIDQAQGGTAPYDAEFSHLLWSSRGMVFWLFFNWLNVKQNCELKCTHYGGNHADDYHKHVQGIKKTRACNG